MRFPYRIVVLWSDADESYIARVPALPNLAVHGSTVGEAAEEARRVGEAMIDVLGLSSPARES